MVVDGSHQPEEQLQGHEGPPVPERFGRAQEQVHDFFAPGSAVAFVLQRRCDSQRLTHVLLRQPDQPGAPQASFEVAGRVSIRICPAGGSTRQKTNARRLDESASFLFTKYRCSQKVNKQVMWARSNCHCVLPRTKS